MLENMVNPEGVSILQCQEIAKDVDASDSMTFELHGPKGKKKAKWLDAYMGLFQIEGEDGFFMVKDFKYAPGLICKNLNKGDK